MTYHDRLTAEYGRAPHPDEYADGCDGQPDIRTGWQIICEHWHQGVIGAVIGSLLIFPGIELMMTAIAVVAEALK